VEYRFYERRGALGVGISDMKLTITDLEASIQDKHILKKVSLSLQSGEMHALMGPNGSGKSTLSSVLLGHPYYEMTGGSIMFDNIDISELDPNERALKGIFMAFQYPVEIPGVTVGRFLRRAVELRYGKEQFSTRAFIKELRAKMDFMEIDQRFINRYLNDGFSGGEKKRMEILQMMMLRPKLAILDETDSGLDIDALKVVAKGVNQLKKEDPDFGALIITHYQRLLNYIIPDYVHIMYEGRIVRSGGSELAHELEAKGYDWIKEEATREAEHAS